MCVVARRQAVHVFASSRLILGHALKLAYAGDAEQAEVQRCVELFGLKRDVIHRDAKAIQRLDHLIDFFVG